MSETTLRRNRISTGGMRRPSWRAATAMRTNEAIEATIHPAAREAGWPPAREMVEMVTGLSIVNGSAGPFGWAPLLAATLYDAQMGAAHLVPIAFAAIAYTASSDILRAVAERRVSAASRSALERRPKPRRNTRASSPNQMPFATLTPSRARPS